MSDTVASSTDERAPTEADEAAVLDAVRGALREIRRPDIRAEAIAPDWHPPNNAMPSQVQFRLIGKMSYRWCAVRPSVARNQDELLDYLRKHVRALDKVDSMWDRGLPSRPGAA